MKYRVAETLLALWFLFTSYSVFSSRLIENELIMLGLGLFYFTTAYAVFRRLSWSRYLVYLNLVAAVLIVIFLLYFAGLDIVPRLLVPVAITIFSVIYCHRRYKNLNQPIVAKREASFFALSLAAFMGVMILISFQIGPTVKTLSAPVLIQKNGTQNNE